MMFSHHPPRTSCTPPLAVGAARGTAIGLIIGNRALFVPIPCRLVVIVKSQLAPARQAAAQREGATIGGHVTPRNVLPVYQLGGLEPRC